MGFGLIIVKNIATSMELFCPYWLVKLLNTNPVGASPARDGR
jgi:hypothetical protein